MSIDSTHQIDPSSDRSRPGLLSTIRSHALTVLGVTVLAAVLTYSASWLLPTVYSAEASVFLGANGRFDPTGDSSSESERFNGDQAELMTTADVLARAGSRMRPQLTVDEVRGMVTATASADTSRIFVTVESSDPEQARRLADAVVDSYRQAAAQRVGATLAAAQEGTDDQFLLSQMRMRAAGYGDGVIAVEPAELPIQPSAPRPAQNALLGAAVALLLGIGALLLRDRRLAHTATVADLDLLIGAPLITRFDAPASSAITNVVSTDPPLDQVRAAQDVLTAIDIALDGETHPSVLFLSWQRALTTTSLVFATGIAAARAGHSATLVDGGMKRLGVSAMTEIELGMGLEALADTDRPLSASIRPWYVADVRLDVVPLDRWTRLPTGAAARPQLLRSAVTRLKDSSSLVLIDGPPLDERSLGLALGRGVDGVVLVIDEGTTVDDAHEIGRRVALSGVRVLGYVLTGPPKRAGVRRLTWTPKRVEEGAVSLGAAPGSPRQA